MHETFALTITSRSKYLSAGTEPDDVNRSSVFRQRRKVFHSWWVWCIFLSCEGGVGGRGDGRDIGVNHPYLHVPSGYYLLVSCPKPVEGGKGWKTYPHFGITTGSCQPVLPSSSCSSCRRAALFDPVPVLFALAGCGRSQETFQLGERERLEIARVNRLCFVPAVNVAGSARRGTVGVGEGWMLTRSQGPWVSLLECMERGYGYGELSEGKREWCNHTTRGKRIAPKESSVGRLYSFGFDGDDSNYKYGWTGRPKGRPRVA